MQDQANTNTKTSATAHLIARRESDQKVELIIDVTGGYPFRDRLKAEQFQFVKDRSEALGAAAPLDKSGSRKHTAAWRRFLIVVPPEASPEQAISALEAALDTLDSLLGGVLEGARIKGAKSAALTLQRQLSSIDGADALLTRLSALDTPWVDKPVTPQAQLQPAFVA
ncbi:hypothetical protein [Ruficoccus sp. ZRK36]|uniref:hypothetical protein n=1 Tax=Ruficoccus sp. ZRK36 TaxID=2866311 RepID=UPI001C730BF2|nr:hypothetical protein [Ruficoccus sp. ZRK36]QYY34800.1 hypothetical protein K0V07_10865 [Ruficoccus sp. ZRK36]QYY37294.1 hypothetical protein K0V07_07365 [Ruficoccus sp. ZRK36]